MYEVMNDMAELFIRVLKMIIAVVLLIVLFVTIPLWIIPFMLYKRTRGSRKGSEVRKEETA